MKSRLRISLLTMMMLVAAIGAGLKFSTRWRFQDHSGCGMSSWGVSTVQRKLSSKGRNQDAKAFLKAHGFSFTSPPYPSGSAYQLMFADSNQSIAHSINPNSQVMEASINGYGKFYIAFSIDHSCGETGRDICDYVMAEQYELDSPWFLASGCKEKLNQYKSIWNEFSLWAKYWPRYRIPYDQALKMLNSRHFQAKSDEDVIAELDVIDKAKPSDN